jgi:hypothetical protein
MNRRILVTAVILLSLSSCNCNNNRSDLPASEVPPVTSAYASAEEKIKEGVTMLREGDLVVRNGQEPSSHALRSFSKTDKSYSHAGLVFFDNGYPVIYHILPGDQNPSHKLTRDSLFRFAAPRRNSGFAIYRYQLQPEEKAALSTIIHQWHARGILFDSSFNLQDDDHMYCSEMIYKAMKQATNGRITFNKTKLTKGEMELYSYHTHIPVADIKFTEAIAIDNLYIHASCALVKKFSFIDTTQVNVKN